MSMAMVAGFPWGVLLAADSEATDFIPSWGSDSDVVTHSETALVLRVLHEDDGEVAVSIGTEVPDAVEVFDGGLRIDSGVLRVGDALGRESLDVSVAPGEHRVRVFVDTVQEAKHVYLLIGS
jgi:hypothetical protein